MTAIASHPVAVHGVSRLDPFPQTMQVTAAAIRAWQLAGYSVSEHRKANWVYLVARGQAESAVYKIVGPRFYDRAVTYEGFRVA
ncbi:MAG: hypothetical protein QOI15_2174 [Pseudonocardiales bacterium]|nr:hypothetical protein [Pseudonocardiales bacterium]MDT4921272.1 hypothetical protein [Pseudonocardiales bacterium]